MERSLKLKLGPPNGFADAKEAYDVGASPLKPQWPTNVGGCMAANGDEASIILQTNFFQECPSSPSAPDQISCRPWPNGSRDADCDLVRRGPSHQAVQRRIFKIATVGRELQVVLDWSCVDEDFDEVVEGTFKQPCSPALDIKHDWVVVRAGRRVRMGARSNVNASGTDHRGSRLLLFTSGNRVEKKP